MGLFKKKDTESIMSKAPVVKRAKGKLVGAILTFVIASVICFGILPHLYASQNATEKVVVCTAAITKGEEITDKNVELKEIGTYGLPGNRITDLKSVLGQYAQISMCKGDFLTKKKVGETGDAAQVAKMMKEGKQLVSISVSSNASAVSGHLLPGDVVNVYTFAEDEFGDLCLQSNPLLMKMRIYDVENEDTASVERLREETDEEDLKETIAATITFEASQAQAEALIRAEAGEGIHVVLVSRESEKTTEEVEKETKTEDIKADSAKAQTGTAKTETADPAVNPNLPG